MWAFVKMIKTDIKLMEKKIVIGIIYCEFDLKILFFIYLSFDAFAAFLGFSFPVSVIFHRLP